MSKNKKGKGSFMKNSILKLTCIVLITIFTVALMPIAVRAANNTDGILLEKADGSKIIYVKDMKNTEFKYAFSDNEDSSGATFITASKDTNDEYVATMEKDATAKYLFVQTEGGTNTIEIAKQKTISEDEIKNVEKLTKIIGVKTTETDSAVSKDGDKTITTINGKIVITDEGTYQYQIFEVVDKNSSTKTPNETAVHLYNQLSKLENADGMYNKLLAEITIRDDYKILINNAKWEDAKKNEIPQPKDSQKDEVFVVIIREAKDGKEVRKDVQFMTTSRQDAEGVEKTSKEVTKKIKLPVTGENLALYIVFGVIILAIIILIVKMRKTKQDEEK